jgi:hypothetical protein
MPFRILTPEKKTEKTGYRVRKKMNVEKPLHSPCGLWNMNGYRVLGLRWHAIAITAAWLVFLSIYPNLAFAEIPCTPSDYAPESYTVRSSPGGSGPEVRTLPRETASLVLLDAQGDWLKIRSGDSIGWIEAKYAICRLTPKEAESVIMEKAEKAIKALAMRNMISLAGVSHPVKGVRFSPYASLDETVNPVLTARQLKTAFGDRTKRVWGHHDGSGEPIRMTFAQYYGKYVYDRDYAKAPQRRFNSPPVEFTERDNIWDLYPNAIIVEYRFPEKAEGAIPWASIRLVFELDSGQWKLVAIVHDSWTI